MTSEKEKKTRSLKEPIKVAHFALTNPVESTVSQKTPLPRTVAYATLPKSPVSIRKNWGPAIPLITNNNLITPQQKKPESNSYETPKKTPRSSFPFTPVAPKFLDNVLPKIMVHSPSNKKIVLPSDSFLDETDSPT